MERIEEAPVREQAIEPAKRWFNWWRVHLGEADQATLNGRNVTDGEQVMNPCAWPSEDIARQRAAEMIVQLTDQAIDQGGIWGGFLEYVGAYPEGDEPHRPDKEVGEQPE